MDQVPENMRQQLERTLSQDITGGKLLSELILHLIVFLFGLDEATGHGSSG